MLIYSDAMQWWHGSAELLLLMWVLIVMKIYADIDKGDNADYAQDADNGAIWGKYNAGTGGKTL